MIFFVLICLMLAVMSYFSLTKDTFSREYSFQYHDLKTNFYYIGIFTEDLGCDEQKISCLTIGLLFFVFRITTYAHTEGTILEYPWLQDESTFPTWQKLLIKLYRLLQIPVKKLRDTDKFV